ATGRRGLRASRLRSETSRRASAPPMRPMLIGSSQSGWSTSGRPRGSAWRPSPSTILISNGLTTSSPSGWSWRPWCCPNPAPSRQTRPDPAVVAGRVGDAPAKPALQNPWPLFEQVLGWDARHVAGGRGGPALPDDLFVRLPEHDTTLGPTWAIEELEKGGDRR